LKFSHLLRRPRDAIDLLISYAMKIDKDPKDLRERRDERDSLLGREVSVYH